MSLLIVCWALFAVVVCWNIYQNIMSTLLQLLSGILHGSILICIGCALFFLWVTYQFRLNGTFCLYIIHYRYHTDDTHGVVCVEVYRLHTAYVFCWFLLPVLVLFCCLGLFVLVHFFWLLLKNWVFHPCTASFSVSLPCGCFDVLAFLCALAAVHNCVSQKMITGEAGLLLHDGKCNCDHI